MTLTSLYISKINVHNTSSNALPMVGRTGESLYTSIVYRGELYEVKKYMQNDDLEAFLVGLFVAIHSPIKNHHSYRPDEGRRITKRSIIRDSVARFVGRQTQ